MKAGRGSGRLIDTLPVYTIMIETPEETTTDEAMLTRFHDAIVGSPELRSPSAGLDHERGVISSRFQVEADTLAEAQDVGIRVFVDALWLAGLNGEGLWRIVEADEEPASARRSLKGD
jgi:hypothetical protein